MGLSRLAIYLDTNFFIMLIERKNEDLRDFVTKVSDRSVELVTSELTLSELLVKPLQQDWPQVYDLYEETIRTGPFLTVRAVDRDVLTHSARLRAELGNKLPDSIHLATAELFSCKFIATSDKRLRLPPGLARLDEFSNEGFDWP